MQLRVIGRQASLSLYTDNSQGGNYVDGSTRRRRAYTIAASPFHKASNQIRRRGFSLTNRYTADNNLFRQLRSRCKTIRCGFIRLHHYNKQHFLIGYMVLTACIGLYKPRIQIHSLTHKTRCLIKRDYRIMNQHQLLSVRKFALFCRELLHREAERERRLRGQNTICISTDAYCILATQPTLTFGFGAILCKQRKFT